MFWGTGVLKRRLPTLITEFDEARIDRATYRLRVGPEAYISPTGQPNDPAAKPKILLQANQGFVVPAGQFAFLLTEEVITVPSDALAFISVRARYKFRGLVNVSGFHVDPGWSGRLIFAVFNAGPGPVQLARGEECFHIWFASLTEQEQQASKKGFETIPSEIINPIAGEIQSFAGLLASQTAMEKRLDDRLDKVERDHGIMKWASSVITAVFVGVFVTYFASQCQRPRSTPAETQPASTPSTASPTSMSAVQRWPR